MRASRSVILAAFVLARATSAAAQSDTTRVVEHLFVKSDWYVLGDFTAGTIAMVPLDRHLASVVRDEDLVTNRDLERVSNTLGFLGGPGPLIIGGVMYVAGRYAHVERAADLAVHGTEAVLVGLATTFVLKTTLGRARPYITADTNPRNFGLGRGFKSTSYQSFPSGHSTAAFAAAAAVATETAEWWPRTRWIIAPIVYGGATLVGVSRMYEDKHWASDVVLGAAVGVFAGLKTVRFNHTHAGNRIDRWLLGDSKTATRAQLRFTPIVGSSPGLAVGFNW